jgi:two-component system chemotaxis sensor kinase CheA
MAKKSDKILRLLTSNQFENPRAEAVLEDMLRYVIYNVALIFGAAFLISFGITVILGGNMVRGVMDIILGFACITVIFLLRTKIPFVVSGLIPMAPFCGLCAILVISGGEQGFAGLWIYAYPILAVFILGMKVGLLLSGLLLGGIAAATFVSGLAGFNYTPPIALRIIAVYILVLVLTIVYEQIRVLKDRWVKQLTKELKTERDEIAVMKDNLKVGLFLMDNEYHIQPAYSKALEDVLSLDELQGKKFSDILSSSITAKERDTLEDYFTMVLKRSFDAKMLEEINPISEFAYVSGIDGSEKILRSSFATVDRGSGGFFILGTLEDITAAKQLQKRLDEEELKREAEMRSLFEVVQVEPRVFSDFIEDTEYEFDRINDVLKNRKLSAHEVMIDIYQSVHAVKSNALILGLENFSGKLHDLESGIKTMRDKDDVSFEEILHLTVELEKIMKEKDKFRETIEKIQAFKVGLGESRRQDRYVLVETLTKACEKASAALGKRAKFVVDELDGIVLEYGPRRVIKEVLTQLVRNSVYHGIESPEERKSRGKNTEGSIRLSIKYRDNKIHIKLADDGRGLDFGKIRKKAQSLNMIKDADEPLSNSRLLQMIFAPGFSTAEEADLHAGRGIGLNLVKERIGDLHGSIKLQTEPGKGTVFNIFIPLVMEQTQVHKAVS